MATAATDPAAAAPPRAPKSLDAYLPSAVRGSPALLAQARTPRTTAAALAGADVMMPDFALDGPPALVAPALAPPPATTPAGGADDEGAPSPRSPARKAAETVSYTMGGAVGGCDSLGMVTPAGPAGRRRSPPAALPATLSSPANK